MQGAFSDGFRLGRKARKIAQRRAEGFLSAANLTIFSKPKLKTPASQIAKPSAHTPAKNKIHGFIPEEIWFPGPAPSDSQLLSSGAIIKNDMGTRSDTTLTIDLLLSGQSEDQLRTESATTGTIFVNPQHMKRVLYNPPEVYIALDQLNIDQFKTLWKSFLNDHLYKRSVWTYDLFKPSWFDTRTTFVSRGKILNQTGTGLVAMPQIHGLRNKEQLSGGKSILAAWIMRELNTRARLAKIIQKTFGIIVPLPPHDLTLLADRVTRLSRTALYFLDPSLYPADSVLNEFLSLLRSPNVEVADTDFTYYLLNFNAVQIRQWWASTKNSMATRIILPLKDSATKQWGIAVINRQGDHFEIIDATPSCRTFYLIAPLIMRFIRAIGWDWKKTNEPKEKNETLLGVDAPILMCYHAFAGSQGGEVLEIPVTMQELRLIIRKCVLIRCLSHLFEVRNASSD